MPVTGSGEIKLRADVNEEINGNDTDTNVSLRSLSDDAGKSVPDSLAEFYGYSSVVAPTVSVGSESVATTSLTVRGTLSNNGGESISTGDMKIYFGTNSNVTSNTQYSVSHSTGTSGASGSTYTYSASSLTAGTTYYFAYKATNAAGTTTSSTGNTTTPLPTLGMGGSLNHGSIASASMAANACNATCVSTYGWGGTQNSNGQHNWTSQASTPTGITLYGYCNWSPWSALIASTSTDLPGNSTSGNWQWNTSVNVAGVVNWPPGSASCGTCLTTYMRYTKTGYQTSYINNGGVRFGT